MTNVAIVALACGIIIGLGAMGASIENRSVSGYHAPDPDKPASASS